MKKFYAALLVLCLLLGGCAQPKEATQQLTYLDLFDTVTTVMGTGADFRQKAQTIHDGLLRYHKLFDIYHGA